MYRLPDLPYGYDALEPHIDARTMEIHHSKHHRGYVDNLNQALEKAPELEDRKLEELLRDLTVVPDEIRTAVRNNGGGHSNHSLFWQSMSSQGGGDPEDRLAEEIDDEFGTFDSFRQRLTDAAMSRYGSGWAWLVLDNGDRAVTSTANQDSPLMEGKIPLLGIDVWEHAYYLEYQNRRADYVDAWWNVVSWSTVAERYESVRAQSKAA